MIAMICAIVVTMFVMLFRFGVSPSLQDNFVASLDTEYSSSAELMTVYGLLNLYVYTMAYVYSPGSAANAVGTRQGRLGGLKVNISRFSHEKPAFCLKNRFSPIFFAAREGDQAPAPHSLLPLTNYK